MPENSQESVPWRVARLEDAIREQAARHERETASLKDELKAVREKMDSRDRGLQVAGILFLLGIIGTLCGVIWANLGNILPPRS